MIVGVDVGGTKILARLVDPTNGAATRRVKLPTPSDGPKSVLDAVAEVVEELDPDAEADAIGVGVPGLVRADGVVTRCPNIVGWTEPVKVSAGLAKRLKRPVTVANDVNCGAVAEHRVGAGVGFKDVLAVFVGTGVGGGLVLENQLRSGEGGMAGEIGHLTVFPGGRVCGCGRRGHLEAYAGRAGIEREARRRADAGERNLLVDLANKGTIKSRHLERALQEGDSVAEELLAGAVSALAIAIGNVTTMLDLQCVVFGGGVVHKLGQDFIDQIEASPDVGGFGSSCELKLAKHLDDAGVVGAAILAADALGAS